jgi:hypothetical protein
MRDLLGGCDWPAPSQGKKADVFESPAAFEHVGLLVNKPRGRAGLPFGKSSDD